MKLSELQAILGLHSGQAWSSRPQDPPHVQEDADVWLVDHWGGKHPIGEVRLDFAPETRAEADADVRHPVIEIYPVLEDGDRD